MPLTFDEFNAETDTEEYLRLVGDNMRVIRGEFEYFFLKNKERKQLPRFLKKSKMVTIKVDGELAGFVVYTFIKDRSTLVVEQLHLKPQFRGRGFGTQTLEFVENKAKELGCARLELGVYASNPALSLYTRFGFKKARFWWMVCWWIYLLRKNI